MFGTTKCLDGRGSYLLMLQLTVGISDEMGMSKLFKPTDRAYPNAYEVKLDEAQSQLTLRAH